MEWGGLVSNDTALSGDKDFDMKLIQTDKADLYMSIPLDKKGTGSIMARGSFKFTYDDSPSASELYEYVLNLDTLSVSKVFSPSRFSSVAISCGRFDVMDSTGIMFAQQSDGVQVRFSNAAADLAVYCGYTGLLNAKAAKIFVSSEETDYEEDDWDLYTLAPRYLPYGFSASFPALFWNQTLTVQGWGFQDLEDFDTDRYYASLSLDGGISKYFAYRAETMFGTEDFATLMNYSALRLDCFPIKGLMMSLNGNYSSGSHGGFSPFVGFSKVTAFKKLYTDVYYSGIIQAGMSASKVFWNVLNVGVGGTLVYGCMDKSVDYDGVLAKAFVQWNVFPDVQAGASYTQFVGDNSDDTRSDISLQVSIAF